MATGKGRKRPTTKSKALGEIESSTAAPGQDEIGVSPVAENDMLAEDGLQIDQGNESDDDEDPWLETIKDLARLVLAAYEEDPHRFDETTV